MLRKILFILLIPIFLLSCDMWNVDIVGFLEYYTNTAGIELIEYGGNYPEDNDGLVNIPSGAPRTITFTLRNPQSYNLNVSLVDWVDGNAPSTPDDYTIEQSPTDKSKITLTFTEDSLLSWDKSGGKNLSATVRIQERDSERIFDDYKYSLAVNSNPISPSSVFLGKNNEIASGNWVLAFNAGTLADRQGIHGDITSVTINGGRYGLTTGGGTLTVDSSLDTENPSDEYVLEDEEGLGFIHSVGNSVYFYTGQVSSQSPVYTVSFTDSRGLSSSPVTVSSVGKIRSNYYVAQNASGSNAGTANNPYRDVESAVVAIENAIAGDSDKNAMYTIHIKGNVDGGSSDSESSIVIDSDSTLNITLQGWGEDAQGTITAESGKRVLYVGGAGVNVTLGENLTLTGGNETNGAGVFVDRNARFTIAGGEIQGNTAVHGAGVYVENGIFSMTKGTIRSNTADNSGNGGGVYINAGSFSMTGGTIGGTQDADANKADIDGGGIFINHGATVTLDGGTISGNVAGLAGGCSGGAIYVEDGATLTMKSGTISGNEADFGGAIAVNGDGKYNGDKFTTERSLFTLSGGTISGNTANNNAGDSKGGAVFVSENLASFIMNGGSIIGNEAVNNSGHNTYGGGVFVDEASFTLNKGEINGNTATTSGGGVYVSDRSTFTMTGGNIGSEGSPNTAMHGGGVYLIDANFTMSGGGIAGNRVDASSNGKGGGLYSTGSDFIMSGGSITGNYSSYFGGGVLIENNSAFTMPKNSTAKVEANEGRYGAGVFVGVSSEFLMENGSIIKNYTHTVGDNPSGGGVYVWHSTNFTMTGGLIALNTAQQYGGGVNIRGQGANSIFNMSGGTITKNTAGVSGGGVLVEVTLAQIPGIFNISGNPTIKNNVIEGSVSGEVLAGGSKNNVSYTYIDSSKQGKINVTDVLIGSQGSIGIRPHAYTGDEIVITGGVTDANKNIFTSDIEGVSFYRVGNDLKVLPPIDEIYIGNTSLGNGDGLTSGSRMAVTNQDEFEAAIAKFSRGSGTLLVGSALQVSESGTWQADSGKDITLQRNTLYTGALINLTSGELTLQNLTIDGQGGVNSLGGSVSATDPLIRVESGATLTLNDGATLQNNKNEGNTGEGGAIYSSGTINLKDGSNIENNIADMLGKTALNSPGKGGGVYANGGTIHMYEGATISGNNAKGQEAKGGGVALFNNAIFNFYGGSISDNINTNDSTDFGGDDQKGAGVYIDDSTLIMSGSTSIIRDNASDEGGGVYMASGELSMSAGSITSNNAYKNNNPNGNGGGVYIAGGTLELSGSPKITGNTNNGDGINETANVYFTNGLSSSPIKITGDLEEDTSVSPPIVPAIGLSPSYTTAGYMLVQSSGSTFSETYFTRDDEGEIERIGANLTLPTQFQTIFLSGQGRDEDDGITSGTAVKTFARALELLKDTNTATIWVTAEVEVSSSQEWNGRSNSRANAVIVRRNDLSVSGSGTDFTGNLIKVTGGTLTLRNITIDGMAGFSYKNENGTNTTGLGSIDAQAPLINVSNAGTLEIESGTVLQNNENHNNEASSSNGFGGAVRSVGEIRMNGGEIKGNNAPGANGGGVYLEGGSFTMTSGTIRGNSADYGGGVYVFKSGTVFTMSGNNSSYISGNTGIKEGGGVQVGENATFNMTGGTIGGDNPSNDGNTAGTGGGIFTWRGTIKITGGSIKGNTASSGGDGVHSISGTYTNSGGSVTDSVVQN